MKLLQLNAWGGRLENQILDLFKKEQPDIICLQEAISLPEGNSNGLFLPVETIAEKMDMHLSYSPTMSFDLMACFTEFGNAILSTVPFTSERTIFTRKEYIKNFNFSKGDHNVRNLLHVTIEHNREVIHILTHHGHLAPYKSGDDETMRQCRLIADYLTKLRGKVILTGDFNLVPHSRSLEQINSVMHNASINNGLSTTRTAITFMTEVCDYIFTNDLVAVRSFRACDDLASDHKALVMEFA